MRYQCPEWCIHKNAAVEEFDGVAYGPKHQEYSVNIHGESDPAFPDPDAPEHQSATVDLMALGDAETRSPSKMSVDVRITQLHGHALVFELYSSGDGIYDESDPKRAALEAAKAFEIAALRLRRWAADNDVFLAVADD